MFEIGFHKLKGCDTCDGNGYGFVTTKDGATRAHYCTNLCQRGMAFKNGIFVCFRLPPRDLIVNENGDFEMRYVVRPKGPFKLRDF
jgi:hypothetical protein